MVERYRQRSALARLELGVRAADDAVKSDAGVILSETDTAIEFQIKGLGEKSRFRIEKSRIKRFWREENDHWEFEASNKAHDEAAERVRQRKAKKANPPEVLTFELPEPLVAGRSSTEVRADLIARAVDRMTYCVPDSLPLQGLLALGGNVS